jgi:uncharacterized protein (TIGR03067 family)
MRSFLCLVFLLLSSGYSSLYGSDADQLQGTWQITALLDEGALVPEEAVRTRFVQDLRFTFSGQTISFIVPGTLQTRTVLFLNDEKANPKTLDLGGAEKVGSRGIYMLSGDTLMVCIGEAGVNQRPTDFSANKNSPQMLMTLKRVPKAATPQPQPQPAPPPPTPPNDETIRKFLVGTWGHQDEDWVVLFTLNADGTYSSTRTYKDKFGKIFHENVRSSGTWNLENGVVVCKITASTDKNQMNQIFSYRIQSISATEVLAIDQFGKWRREWKAP